MEFDYKAAQRRIDALVPLVKREARKQVKALLWPKERNIKVCVSMDSRKVKDNPWHRSTAYQERHIVLSVSVSRGDSYRMLIVLGVRERHLGGSLSKYVAMVVMGIVGTHCCYTAKKLETRIPQAVTAALDVLENYTVRAVIRRDREATLKKGAKRLARDFPKWSCEQWDKTRRRKNISDNMTAEIEVAEDGYRLRLEGEITPACIRKIVKVLETNKPLRGNV